MHGGILVSVLVGDNSPSHSARFFNRKPGSGARPTSPSRPHAAAFKSRGDGNFHLEWKSSAGKPRPDHAQFRDDRSLTPADNLSLFSRERLHFRFSEQLTFCSELRSRRDSISHLPRFCFRCERQRERARDPWGGGGEVEVMAQESRRYINHKSACDLIR